MSKEDEDHYGKASDTQEGSLPATTMLYGLLNIPETVTVQYYVVLFTCTYYESKNKPIPVLIPIKLCTPVLCHNFSIFKENRTSLSSPCNWS
jgi:hypothetical protein